VPGEEEAVSNHLKECPEAKGTSDFIMNFISYPLIALLTVPVWLHFCAFPPPITVVVATLFEKKGALTVLVTQALNPVIFLSVVTGILKFFNVICYNRGVSPAPSQKKHSLLI